MTGFAFIIYSFAVVCLLIYLAHLTRKPIGATFFFITFVVFFHAFAFPYYVEIWTGQLGYGLLQEFIPAYPELVPTATFAMALCYLFILLGCYVGDVTFGRTGYNQFKVESQQLTPTSVGSMKGILELVTGCELLIVALLVYQYAFIASPTALFDYYLSDLDSSARVDIRRTANLSFYIPAILHLTVMPLLLFVVFVEALKSKSQYLKHRAYRFGFLLVFLKLSTFNKAAPALILIQLLFCYTLYSRQTLVFSLRYIRFGIIALTIAFSFVWLVRGETADFETAFDDYFYRLLMIPNEAIFEYFNAIPAYYPFGYGAGLNIVIQLFGNVGNTEQNLATHNLVASVYRHDFNTVVNGFFIAEAWAQFSWAGIVGMSLLAGFLVKWYDSVTAKLKSPAIKIGMIVFSIYGAYALSTAAVTTSLLTGGLLIVPIFSRFLDKIKRDR